MPQTVISETLEKLRAMRRELDRVIHKLEIVLPDVTDKPVKTYRLDEVEEDADGKAAQL